MSFSQLSNELKSHILSHLVNVERGHSEVTVAHESVIDGEQYIRYNLQPAVFGIDHQTRVIVWDQIQSAVLVALYVDGGPELRPSLHVPVITDCSSDATQAAMASLRPHLRIGGVVIKTRSTPTVPLRRHRKHFSLLPARSLAVYVRILAAKQGGCLPLHCRGRLAPTSENMLSATCYEVFIDISGYDNSKPGTLDQLLAALEPLHGLGNAIHLYRREDTPGMLERSMDSVPQDALRQWCSAIYDHLLFTKRLVDRLYLDHCDAAFGCCHSVSVPLRFYDLGLDCFRFALALRSGRDQMTGVDEQWLESARQRADQLAICAGYSLLSITLAHGGSIHHAVDHRATWPGVPDCGKHFCLCHILTVLGDSTESVFGLERHAKYGLDKKTWLLMQHTILVHHHLPDFDAEISHIETLYDDLRELEGEMKHELGTGTSDLTTDLENIRVIKHQWRRYIESELDRGVATTLPIELFEGEEVYDDDVTQVVLQRLSVAKRRKLLVLDDGRPTLHQVSSSSQSHILLEGDMLGSRL